MWTRTCSGRSRSRFGSNILARPRTRTNSVASRWPASVRQQPGRSPAVTRTSAGSTTGTMPADIASSADNYFEYDGKPRVTKEIAADVGFGTYTFSYTQTGLTDPNPNAVDYNVWVMKTTETLPDGNQNIVYMNEIGQPMLKIFNDTASGTQWDTFYKYDDAGRVILKAYPSAVTGYDDTKNDLLNSV